MTFLILLLIGATAIFSSALGHFGWHKAESIIDGAIIALAMVWIARGPQPCMLADPDHPWDRPATRHAIDWRDR